METEIIRVTDKGQISLPIGMRKSARIERGDKLLVVQDGEIIILEKVKKDDFKDLLKHSEKVAKKLWGSKKDDIWNTF